ncbi:MAG TPA: hypothetical protein DCG57_05820 [Candidatus Riflebacteria bacterium]|jgi:hypothetical protein|nr:hypothetical protein [Candidatus Riflebacteria bacterium]
MIIVPTISEMIHHIKRCPPEFLAPPLLRGRGEINTEALVNDIFRVLSGKPAAPKKIELSPERRSPAELSLIQICCWALSHPFFRQIDSGWLNDLFWSQLTGIAALVKTELWVTDEERAEELARMILKCCGYVPAGETPEEALDRFDSVNTVKRMKVIEETRAANERAQAIRRQMAEQRAREAANVYGRE